MYYLSGHGAGNKRDGTGIPLVFENNLNETPARIIIRQSIHNKFWSKTGVYVMNKVDLSA